MTEKQQKPKLSLLTKHLPTQLQLSQPLNKFTIEIRNLSESYSSK